MNYYAHPTAIIDEGCEIGDNTKIWHYSHIMGECKLGKNCNLGQNVFIASGVVLGNNVKIQNNVSVFLGPSCVFTNVRNPRSHVNRRGQYTTTFIGKGATIGANATIVCGNNIGAYAFIGAGAVVTHEVPAYALILGNPARQVGWMSEYGHRLNFDTTGKASCPETGDVYEIRNETVSKV
jgi:UDP-2-acetamido-3-amino-2,3-dideoxy-glucuronate N-acetyltransferase